MSKTYTFTLRQSDADLAEALATLPNRSQWIRDALRFYLARQNCEAPSQYHQIFTELADIKMKINQISRAPEPPEGTWDDEGELLDLDI